MNVEIYKSWIVVAVAMLTGCSAWEPIMDSQTFRNRMNESRFGHKETFSSERSFAEVNDIIQQQGAKCLNRTVTTQTTNPGRWQGGMYFAGGTSTDTYRYSTQFRTDENASEFSVFEKINGGKGRFMPAEPEQGHYLLVMDVFNRGGKGVDVALYGPSIGFDPLMETIPDWIEGRSTACPEIR